MALRDKGTLTRAGVSRASWRATVNVARRSADRLPAASRAVATTRWGPGASHNVRDTRPRKRTLAAPAGTASVNRAPRTATWRLGAGAPGAGGWYSTAPMSGPRAVAAIAVDVAAPLTSSAGAPDASAASISGEPGAGVSPSAAKPGAVAGLLPAPRVSVPGPASTSGASQAECASVRFVALRLAPWRRKLSS
jgi:hypothetical protein